MTYRFPQAPLDIPSSWFLAGILIFAALLRQIFFTGFFGSDEVTYTEAAWKIAHGDWQSSDYIGAIRYGVNFPVALFFRLFGYTEFVANLWSMLCSLGEIALVYLLAYGFWGRQAAIFSAVLLAVTPIHAHIAGRLMADSPLGFFITLSFYSLWRGDDQNSKFWYFMAGLAAGGVWWVKSAVAIIYLPAFLTYIAWERRFDWKWLYMAASFLAMFILNCLVHWRISGEPFLIFRISTTGTSISVPASMTQTDACFYLNYLFIDVKHTLLLGPLALMGFILWARRSSSGIGITRVALWGGSLVILFSLFIVGLNPIKLIPKQSNYMLIFLAPLALMGGFFLHRLRQIYAWSILGAAMLGGVILTAMEQQVVQAFTANSKAALDFAKDHTDKPVFSMTNANRMATYNALFTPNPDNQPKILSMSQVSSELNHRRGSVSGAAGILAYAIIDVMTLGWGAGESILRLEDRPACWIPNGTLQPTGFGLGRSVVKLAHYTAAMIPGNIGQRLSGKIDELFNPKLAYVYGIPESCI